MMGRRRHSAVKEVAVGSLLAAAAGYVAGLLTAPKSGKQTRKELKKVAEKGFAEAEKDLKQLSKDLGKVMDEAKKQGVELSGKTQTELTNLLNKAKDSKEKLREMISAVHEGEAENEDLAKAIKDANQAIDHLKDYLKK